MRHFLEIAFHGKNYVGWQLQPHAVSIQQVVTEALRTILQDESIKTMGCGRTDAGVHAQQFFLHFDLAEAPPADFLKRLNKFLPPDIAARRLIPVANNAHARYDATARSYEYLIYFDKNPFLTEFGLFFPFGPLDISAMRQAVKLLPDHHDFDPLSKFNPDLKTTLCNIHEARLLEQRKARQLRFQITANRFLRSMVRRIVGALLIIGKEKMSVEEFRHVMETSGRFKRNLSAPPHGLCLTRVKYPYL